MLILGVTTGIAQPANEWLGVESVIGDSVKRVVSSIGLEPQGTCSGAVINRKKGYLLTAAHCVPTETEGRSIMVDERHAEVVKINYLLDLAVLRVDELRGPNVPLLATDAPVGTGIAVVGYAFGAKRLKYTFGHISSGLDDSLTDGVYLDVNVIPGHSGGVAITRDGRLVGVVQSNLVSPHGTTLGIISTPDALRCFVREFLPVARKK